MRSQKRIVSKTAGKRAARNLRQGKKSSPEFLRMTKKRGSLNGENRSLKFLEGGGCEKQSTTKKRGKPKQIRKILPARQRDTFSWVRVPMEESVALEKISYQQLVDLRRRKTLRPGSDSCDGRRTGSEQLLDGARNNSKSENIRFSRPEGETTRSCREKDHNLFGTGDS